MEKLLRGIHEFQHHHFRAYQDLFARLAAEQHPETLFITCSDSRIDPALLTQTKPGDIFILRNAGNIVPPFGASNGGEGATVEYAVTALGVKDIVVCGHSSCGAMKALIRPESTRDLPMVSAWLQHAETTRRIVAERYGDRPEHALLEAAIQENVLVQLENLRTLPAVAAALAKGTLRLHGWVLRIDTGEVFAFDPASGQFSRLDEAYQGAVLRDTPVIGARAS